MNRKGCGRKRLWPNLRYYPSICGRDWGKLTLWSCVVLGKPPVAQLVKNFPTFCGTRSFIIVSTRAPPLVSILSQMNPVHITPSYLFKICLHTVTCMCVTVDGVRIREWIYWPWLRDTSTYRATANLHNSQITTALAKLFPLNYNIIFEAFFQPAVSSPAVPWQRLLTVGTLQLYALGSSLHDLLCRTQLCRLFITSRHGPLRKHPSYIVARVT
jgi:hypothetical protein